MILPKPERRLLFLHSKDLHLPLIANIKTHTSPKDQELAPKWVKLLHFVFHQLTNSSLDQLIRNTSKSTPLEREEEVSLPNPTERTSVRSISLSPSLLPQTRMLSPKLNLQAEDWVHQRTPRPPSRKPIPDQLAKSSLTLDLFPKEIQRKQPILDTIPLKNRCQKRNSSHQRRTSTLSTSPLKLQSLERSLLPLRSSIVKLNSILQWRSMRENTRPTPKMSSPSNSIRSLKSQLEDTLDSREILTRISRRNTSWAVKDSQLE